jgi:hypothetical protein
MEGDEEMITLGQFTPEKGSLRTERTEAHKRSMATDYSLPLAMKLLVGVLARPQADREKHVVVQRVRAILP